MVTKSVALEVDGIRIAGRLYLPDGRGPYPTVCVCHGIPARAADPNDRGYPLLAEQIVREGLAVFLFNFRGAGASGGNLDMAGWMRDLKAVLDYLYSLPEVDKTHLLLLGFSGGAAVSICVAAGDPRVSGVASCACPAEFNLARNPDDAQAAIERFRNIGVIRDTGFPPSVEKWLDGFQQVTAGQCVGQIVPRPLLLVHGGEDEVVPVSHAQVLFQRAGEPKRLLVLPGEGHRLRLSERAMTAVIRWLKSQTTH